MKKTKRQPSDLPPRPPQDLHEAVLWGAMSECNDEMVADYVKTLYGRGRGNKRDRLRGSKAVLIMSTIGFAFWNWQKARPKEGGSP